MSAGSSLPYRLRPNKAVDRELFLSLLMRLAPKFALEKYHYVGLGGPFLEDFRMIHGRLGIAKMTCIETEEEVHKRQAEEQRRISLEQALAIPLASGRITLNNGRIGISGRLLFSLSSDQLQPEGRQLLSSLVGPLRDYLGDD